MSLVANKLTARERQKPKTKHVKSVRFLHKRWLIMPTSASFLREDVSKSALQAPRANTGLFVVNALQYGTTAVIETAVGTMVNRLGEAVEPDMPAGSLMPVVDDAHFACVCEASTSYFCGFALSTLLFQRSTSVVK
jgi:hypothetical protein